MKCSGKSNLHWCIRQVEDRVNGLTSRYDPDSEHLQVATILIQNNVMLLRRLIPADAICMIGQTTPDLHGGRPVCGWNGCGKPKSCHIQSIQIRTKPELFYTELV